MYPVEEYLSNVFNKFDMGYHKIYQAIKDNIVSDKIAQCNELMAGITEHIVDDNERILVISSYADITKSVSVTIPEDWKLKSALRGDVTVDGNDIKFDIESADTVVIAVSK